jgi:hypothetical protein
MKTIHEFIATHGITADFANADRNPHMDHPDPYARHYYVTLRIPARKEIFELPFTVGSSWKREPTIADVLNCLASDASVFDMEPDFENWAESYGFDPDSRKTEATYTAIKRQSDSLCFFLGDAAYHDLLSETERL